MKIISRREWGAQRGDGNGPAPLPASEVWLHHSVTIAPDLVPPWDDDYAAIRRLEEIGAQRFGSVYGISYTLLITPAALIFEGHDVAQLGAHTGGRNGIARAICLVGNYETAEPTSVQLDAVAWALREGVTRGWWTTAALAGGHRDAPGASTACPGRRAYALIGEINRRAAAGTTTQEDDMATAAELWQHPIDDAYTEKLGDVQPAHVILAHVARNAALARVDAAAALAATERIEKALAARAGSGPGVDVAAIAEAVADELARRAQN